MDRGRGLFCSICSKSWNIHIAIVTQASLLWRATDFMQQLLWQVQPSLAGLIFFATLQAIALGLLILLDIEDNTRRAARGK